VLAIGGFTVFDERCRTSGARHACLSARLRCYAEGAAMPKLEPRSLRTRRRRVHEGRPDHRDFRHSGFGAHHATDTGTHYL
jgi:hypothetical protein